MKNKILYGFMLLMGFFALTGCNDDSIVENPSGETFIYRMFIANGGLAGTDAIQGVEATANNGSGVIYNLAGQRVSKAKKGGIYVINGKKVLVK